MQLPVLNRARPVLLDAEGVPLWPPPTTAPTSSKGLRLFRGLSIGALVIGIVVGHFVFGYFVEMGIGQAGVGRRSMGWAWVPALLLPELILICGFVSVAIWRRPRIWVVLAAALVAAFVLTPLILSRG
jgi:hypothetical protein